MGVPWPITIACIFPVFMAVLATMVWWSRGRVWRVTCDYTGTRDGVPCRRSVRGEWRRCYQHRPGQQRSGGEAVDGRLRWQTKRNGSLVERDDIRGKGFVRDESQTRSLLYHRGFARPPRAVAKFWRDWWSFRRGDLRKLRDQLQAAGALDLRAIWRVPAGPSARTAVNEQLAQAIQATRLVLALALSGLVLVGAAVWRGQHAHSLLNFAATFAFIAAWMVARWGICRVAAGEVPATGPSWWKLACNQTLSRFGGFLIISFLAGQALSQLETLVNGPGTIQIGL